MSNEDFASDTILADLGLRIEDEPCGETRTYTTYRVLSDDPDQPAFFCVMNIDSRRAITEYDTQYGPIYISHYVADFQNTLVTRFFDGCYSDNNDIGHEIKEFIENVVSTYKAGLHFYMSDEWEYLTWDMDSPESMDGFARFVTDRAWEQWHHVKEGDLWRMELRPR